VRSVDPEKAWELSRADDNVDDDGMPGLCQDGGLHAFDGVECSRCGALPHTPDDDRPAGWYAPDPYPGHVCFDDCRHRRR
jgi:hypothetical protein